MTQTLPARRSWESVGYDDGAAGKEFNPPKGAPMTVRDSYRVGWDRGNTEHVERYMAARKGC